MARFNARLVCSTLAAGFGAMYFARGIGQQGDTAYAMGNSAAAASWHLTALFIDLGAVGCFIFALVTMVRGHIGRGKPKAEERVVEPPPRSAVVPETPEEASFDPDAIMARYLAQRNEAAPEARPVPSGFGRKSV
jgi:hypothetical protein